MQKHQLIRTKVIIPYVCFWLAIGVVFEALFLLSPALDVAQAINAGLQIIGVAAILGLAVLYYALRTPMPQEQLVFCFFLHSIGALIYTLLWIGGVSLAGSMGTLFSEVGYSIRMPGPNAFRWHMIAGPVLYTAIVTAIFAIRSFERSQLLLKDAELRTLRARLNPHFLFNTLHTVMMLFRVDTDKAERAIEQFSDLIRYSFHDNQNLVDEEVILLKKEWSISQKYLDLEKIRLGGKLRLKTNIDHNALEFISPKLLLQPLLENAVIHGASKLEGGADLFLRIELKAERIFISVENEFNADSYYAKEENPGIGLDAVRAGLENVFGSKSKMKTSSTAKLFKVIIDIPAIKMDQ